MMGKEQRLESDEREGDAVKRCGQDGPRSKLLQTAHPRFCRGDKGKAHTTERRRAIQSLYVSLPLEKRPLVQQVHKEGGEKGGGEHHADLPMMMRMWITTLKSSKDDKEET